MKKIEREIRRAATNAGCLVEGVTQGKSTHYRVRLVTSGGSLLQLTVSASPTNTEHTIKNFVRDIRKYGNEK